VNACSSDTNKNTNKTDDWFVCVANFYECFQRAAKSFSKKSGIELSNLTFVSASETKRPALVRRWETTTVSSEDARYAPRPVEYKYDFNMEVFAADIAGEVNQWIAQIGPGCDLG
jgi:hypothetical protein